MIDRAFMLVFYRSITGGILVLAVLLCRAIFRSFPRNYYVILWGLVGIRLILPFSIESRVSMLHLFNSGTLFETKLFEMYEVDNDAHLVPENANHVDSYGTNVPNVTASADNDGDPGVHSVPDGLWNADLKESIAENTDQQVHEESYAYEAGRSDQHRDPRTHLFSLIWITGVVLVLVYIIARYISLKRKVAASIEIEPGIRITDYTDVAFVLGVVRPTIYLPSSINRNDLRYVYLHEKAHLDRKDYIWKMAGLLILAVYWHNPLMWVAYVFLNRDIEYACDEKVLEEIGIDNKKSYAITLLKCSQMSHGMFVVPLGISGANIKVRIQRVMRYNGSKMGVHVLAVLVCMLFTACFMTDPAATSDKDSTTEDLQFMDSVMTGLEPVGTLSISEAENGNGTVVYDSSTVQNGRGDTPRNSEADYDGNCGNRNDDKDIYGDNEDDNDDNSEKSDEGGEGNDNEDKIDADARIKNYIQELCMTMAEDSTKAYKADDFASIDGYIVARYLEAMRYQYISDYEEGIKDLSVDVSLGDVLEDKGTHHVEATAVTRFRYDKTLWKRQNIALGITYTITDDDCRCIDVNGLDEAVYRVEKAIEGQNLVSTEDRLAYIDSVFLDHVTQPRFPIEAKKAVINYSEEIFSAANSDSSKVFSPDGFETVYGYLGARFFAALRDYNIRQHGGHSINQVHVNGAKILKLSATNSKGGSKRYIAEADIYYSWMLSDSRISAEHELHQAKHTCEFLLEEDAEGLYRCIEFNNVGAAFEIREAIKANNMTREEAVRYIDSHIDDCAETEPIIGRLKEYELQDPYVSDMDGFISE